MTQIIHNKYEIIRQLGKGSVGNVYLARDLHLNRLVAIKKMENDRRCKTEMELLIQLKHTGLPEVYDYLEEEENCFLVMEFIEGITMKQYLERKGKPELTLCMEWMKELAEILEYLHGNHPPVIYRDLKPSNIMITPEGTVKLIDLGGAFRREHNSREDKVCVGTPSYSAPEQWKGVHVDKTCDVFSYGAVFHELLTGVSPLRPPYERRPIRQYDRSLPSGLEELLEECLREEPGERPASMKHILMILKDGSKAGRRRRLLFELKRCGLAAGILFSILTIIIPLLQGIPSREFPFPYLIMPCKCLMGTLLFYLLFFRIGKKPQFMIRQEKEIWLSEKKGLGLWVLLLLLLGSVRMLFTMPGSFTNVVTDVTDEKRQNLWVDMKDEQNRKILVREGTVFPIEEKLKLELPVEQMPENPVSVKIVAVDETGKIYESREIRVAAVRN